MRDRYRATPIEASFSHNEMQMHAGISDKSAALQIGGAGGRTAPAKWREDCQSRLWISDQVSRGGGRAGGFGRSEPLRDGGV